MHTVHLTAEQAASRFPVVKLTTSRSFHPASVLSHDLLSERYPDAHTVCDLLVSYFRYIFQNRAYSHGLSRCQLFKSLSAKTLQ